MTEGAETISLEGDFVFPNGDTYSGNYISGPNGILREGKGKWISKSVSKILLTFRIISSHNFLFTCALLGFYRFIMATCGAFSFLHCCSDKNLASDRY